MNTSGKLRNFAQVTWAIAGKDISDAIKNKTILANLITIMLVVIFYRFLPALGGEDEVPRLMVYDKTVPLFAPIWLRRRKRCRHS